MYRDCCWYYCCYGSCLQGTCKLVPAHAFLAAHRFWWMYGQWYHENMKTDADKNGDCWVLTLFVLNNKLSGPLTQIVNSWYADNNRGKNIRI